MTDLYLLIYSGMEGQWGRCCPSLSGKDALSLGAKEVCLYHLASNPN